MDKPYYHQYAIFMWDVLHGDFGESIKHREPVFEVIQERIWPTIQLSGGAFLLALLVGIPLGVFSAVWRGTILDQLGRAIALVGQAAPTFWLGIMFMFFFAVKLGWVPPSGKGEWNNFILPMVTLAWGGFLAGSLRLMRSGMLDVMDSEYIKLARAKGVSTRGIIWKHAFRNALIPPLTFAGVSMPAIFNRLPNNRVGFRLARHGPVGDSGPVRLRLSAASGVSHHVYLRVCASRFDG